MIHFLKLIRIKNLAIVTVTQLLMRYAVIEPILLMNGFELQFPTLDFFWLVFATVALTAAGYTINDYFDTKTDMVNRPDSIIVGKHIKRQNAMTLHVILNIIGVFAGFYISIKMGLYQLGFIFVLISGILWYYSTTYKRQFLIGNILVAFLTAMVPIVVVLYEIPMLNSTYREFLLANKMDFTNIFAWIFGFSFFAFMTTLIREIIKDIEDFEGDTAFGRNTLPIVWGVKMSKIVLFTLILITIVSIAYVYWVFLSGIATTIYFSLLLSVFLFLIIRIYKAKSKENYHLASNVMKIIMLFGISYSFIVYYIFRYTF